jgi:hypothetical protein
MLRRWRSLKNHEAPEASFRGLRLPIRSTGLTSLVKPWRVFPSGGVVLAMVTLLRYVGKSAAEEAEAELRSALPGASVRHKASSIFEVDGALSPELLPSNWVIHVPTVADINPPRPNFKAMRAALRR